MKFVPAAIFHRALPFRLRFEDFPLLARIAGNKSVHQFLNAVLEKLFLRVGRPTRLKRSILENARFICE